MKLKSVQKVMGGILGAAVLLGVPACSDDHYDIKSGSQSASNTIWQNIEATPSLDSLAMILKQVRVYTKMDDKKRTLTYAELLNQPQSFTFFAPVNDTYKAKSYLDQIDQAKVLRASGLTAQADTIEYNLGVQFAQNHLARFNFESNKSEQELYMYNGKLISLNLGDNKFNNRNIVGDIPSSNGMLHALEGVSKFSYNVYEFMGSDNALSSIYGILNDPSINKRTFSESSSTAGGMNSEGNMVYIDSVYTYNNELLNSCGAQIKNEDSMYVAVIPTNEAWKQAKEKLNKLFNYADYYMYNYAGGNLPSSAFPNRFDITRPANNPDSIRDYNVERTLITNMYFTPSIWAQKYKRDDIAGIAQHAMKADSLITTTGKVFYNPNKGGKNPLFGDGHYEQASNGVVFPVTSYVIDPSYTFMQSNTIDMINTSAVGDAYIGGQSSKGEYTYLTDGTEGNHDENIDISMLETKGYRYFGTGSTRSSLRVFFPLPNLLSGKYRIRMQLLPNRVNTNHKWLRNSTDPETGKPVQEEVEQNTLFRAVVYDDEGNPLTATAEDPNGYSKDIAVDEYHMSIVEIFPSVEIKKCYYNLPTGITNCYPLLMVEIPYDRNNRNHYQPNGTEFGPQLSVVKLFIDPVHDGE